MIIGFWDQRLIMGEKISPGLIYLFTRFRNDLVDFKRFSYLKNDLICIGNYKNNHSMNYHFSLFNSSLLSQSSPSIASLNNPL